MELIRGLHNLRARHQGGAAAIGNFDGVHRGHQLVLAQAAGKVRGTGGRTTAISFEPMPSEYFSATKAPARLTRFREKFRAFEAAGVSQFLCLRFDARFAGLSADDFVRQILVEGLAINTLVVGDDFCYGKDRTGNFSSLVRAGEQHGFEVTRTQTFDMFGERVSSSRVRQALGSGNLQLARASLGRPYQISGRVMAGKQLGRKLGFPTANIALKRNLSPLHGVFAVRVSGAKEGELLDGVASLGSRPIVNGDHDLLEVHVFDFNETLYGKILDISFLAKLRDEASFPTLDLMKVQMQKDSAEAQRVLRRYA